jgi:hypothetical protein
MKHLHKFESFISDTYEKEEIADHKQEEIAEHTQRYLSNLSDIELEQVNREIKRFALDNNCDVSDLTDPNFVKTLLSSNVEESIGSWLKDNWAKLCDYIGIGGKIAGIVTFVGSLVIYYANGTDTLTGIKIGVAAFVIANIVQSLKGFDQVLK